MNKKAFTLIELLVVITILAILAAMLLPSLSNAKERGRETRCLNNIHQLMKACLLLAEDLDGRLPGGNWDTSNADDLKTSWLWGRAPVTGSWGDAPQFGTIYSYLCRNSSTNSLSPTTNSSANSLYRCPSLNRVVPGDCVNSNGRFDYSIFVAWTGARLTDIRPESRFTDSSGKISSVPTPIIVEEDMANFINCGSYDGGHANLDQMAHRHRGGCYYGSVSGSVHYFREPTDCNANNWTSQARAGNWAPIGSVFSGSPTFGWWERQ